MSSVSANFKLQAWLLLAMGCGLVGWVARQLEPGGSSPRQSPDREQVAALTGRGLAPALFGGLGPAVAAGCWLRTNLAWEARDEAATIAWIEVTVAADPDMSAYWLNGARMLAYDLPTWPALRDPRHRQGCIERSLRLLEEGLRVRGPDATLLIEMANIHRWARGDLEAAAVHYRRAARVRGAPYYAGRIYGELLVALGRPAEALDWLRQLRRVLPADDPAARVQVVEARIRALEAGQGP